MAWNSEYLRIQLLRPTGFTPAVARLAPSGGGSLIWPSLSCGHGVFQKSSIDLSDSSGPYFLSPIWGDWTGNHLPFVERNEVANCFPGGSLSTPLAPLPKDNNFGHPHFEIRDHTEDRSQVPIAFIQRCIILGLWSLGFTLLSPLYRCGNGGQGGLTVIIHSQFIPF